MAEERRTKDEEETKKKSVEVGMRCRVGRDDGKRDQGNYKLAEAMNRQALEGNEKVLGPEHPFTLTSVDKLAIVLRDQGKYEAAEVMCRRALEGYEKALGRSIFHADEH